MAELTDEQKASFTTNYISQPAKPEEAKLTPAEQQAFEASKVQAGEFMVMKAALLEMTASRGWVYVERFAEAILRDLQREAIDEEDDAKANGLRRDAKGARKFKDELIRRIQMAKSQEPSQFLEIIN